jgi:hypothetical protein
MNYSYTTDESKQKHTIRFETSGSAKDKIENKIKKEQKKNNVLLIDKYVELFNEDHEGMISDYNYKIVSEKDECYEVDIIILFKHMFRNFKETRKYAKFNMKLSPTQVIVQQKNSIKLDLEIPSKAEVLPITKLVSDYKINANNNCETTIVFDTPAPSTEYANFGMAIKLFEMYLTKDMEKHLN